VSGTGGGVGERHGGTGSDGIEAHEGSGHQE
jgi:hypothetical protein